MACSVYMGKLKTRNSVPTKLRSGKFKPPKFTPWDHLAGDRWLPDYAARHLSNLTGREFGTSIPSHANHEQRYSGQGGAFVRLVSDSPQNDPNHAMRDSPCKMLILTFRKMPLRISLSAVRGVALRKRQRGTGCTGLIESATCIALPANATPVRGNGFAHAMLPGSHAPCTEGWGSDAKGRAFSEI